jgi:hypothetical protein
MRRASIGARVVAAALVTGALLLVYVQRDPPARSGTDALPRPGAVAPAHCGGKEVPISSAFDAVPYDIVLPPSGLASNEDLIGVWDCPGTATLLEFASQTTLVLDMNTIQDPAVSWARVASTNPRIYSVGTVQGVPALLIDPEADPDDDAEGGVSVVLNGISVNVGGNGRIPLADLVSATEQLDVIGPRASS